MNMYEVILDILDKRGSVPISFLCQKMNELTEESGGNGRRIDTSSLEFAISRKKELFLMKNDLVFINPTKDPVLLVVAINGYPGPEIRVNVNFTYNRFTYFEWHLDSRDMLNSETTKTAGNMKDFKKTLYNLNIWDWSEDYQGEGIILDGISWNLKLVTKEKIYIKQGLDSFPHEWKAFLRAIRRLTGKSLG